MGKMNNNIIKTIKEFEKNNGIKTSDYYYKKRIKNNTENSYITNDSYIAEEIFEQRISEWLEITVSDDEKECLLKLLSEYLYFPSNRYQNCIADIINSLSEIGLDIKDTLFVTFPSTNGVVCGGDKVSAAIQLATLGEVAKESIVTCYEKIDDNVERFKRYKNIVFFDDIIGSGNTVHRNVLTFFERFRIDSSVNIIVAALCGCERHLKKKIKQFNQKYEQEFQQVVMFPLQKALRQDSNHNDIFFNTVLEIEERVQELALDEDEEDYIGGYQKNQCLVSFYYDTPNNTLSVFWRPTKIAPPIFTRATYTRPSVDDCKNNKRKMMLNAYERGKVKSDINDSDDNPLIY